VSHLGTWVSALVDGQLPPAETERALAHVAVCPTCADEVAAARQARRALSVAADVAPDPELTARLLALGATLGAPAIGPHDQRRRDRSAHREHRREVRRAVVPLGESAYAVPAKALSGDLMGRRNSPTRVLAGALTGAGVVLASLFVLGERPPVVPATHPAEALTVLGRAPHEAAAPRAAGTRGLVTTIATAGATRDPASTVVGGLESDAAVLTWMAEEGWSCPDTLPAGYTVTAVRLTPADEDDTEPAEVLEVDLDGPYGRVVLTEQRGRLDVDALGPAERVAIGGRTVHVLSLHPWHGVWQSDDTVVSMVSEAPGNRAVDVVEHFPVEAYDDGFPARLTRGWHTVTGALPTR
jgi:anti-sigma factor RsiW